MSIWGNPVLTGNNGAVPPYTPPTTYAFKKSGGWYEIPDNFKEILGSTYPYFRLSGALMDGSLIRDNWFVGRFFLAKITDVDMGDNYPHIVAFVQDHFTDTYDYRFYIHWYSSSASREVDITYTTFTRNQEVGGHSYWIFPTLIYTRREQGVWVDTPIVGWPRNAVVLEGPMTAVKDFIENYNGPW